MARNENERVLGDAADFAYDVRMECECWPLCSKCQRAQKLQQRLEAVLEELEAEDERS